MGLCGPVVSLSSGAPYESRYADSDNGMGGTDLGTDKRCLAAVLGVSKT